MRSWAGSRRGIPSSPKCIPPASRFTPTRSVIGHQDCRKERPSPEAQPSLGPLRLLSCARRPATLSATDDSLHPPSGWVHVTTYWDAAVQPAANLAPQIRLVDGAGQVWGEALTRAGDAFHVWPVSRWLPGEILRADFDVNLNPVTPNGVYQLIVEAPGIPEKASCGGVQIVR